MFFVRTIIKIKGLMQHHHIVIIKVPFRVLQHFTNNASMMSVNAEANAHGADRLITIPFWLINFGS